MKSTADPILPGLARGLGAAALGLALVAVAAPAVAVDSDGDGWDDAIDTCSARPGSYLGDVDGDGFGDPCDCDFDNDGVCSLGDFTIFVTDIMAGADSGVGTDMDASDTVDYQDFLLFVEGLQAGAPGPGPVSGGDPATAFPGVACDGDGPTASCTIELSPTIAFEVLRQQLQLDGVDLGVSGDVRIPTATGPLWMLDVSLTLVPGDGPFGFETLRGTAVLRNEVSGLLSDLDVTGAVVDVGYDLGANIEADVPLQPDLRYLFFQARAGLRVDMGPFLIEGPGVATTLIFNPGDPFFYAGAEVANIPIPTEAGIFLLSAGGGVGFSSQGLIPFEPSTSEGLAALFPSFDGHIVNQASGELPSCVGCPTLTFNGYAITDLDPQEDGQLALFGPDSDVALGINGDFGVEGTVGVLSLSVDLFQATGGFESTDDDFLWFVGGRVGSRPDLFALDVATDFDLLPPAAGELGLGVQVSDTDPTQTFVRFEGQGMTIGATGVEAATGVTVASFTTADFYFQTGGAGTFLGGSTAVQQIVQGVRALDEQSWDLSLPKTDVPELVMHSRYEIGTHQLRESTLWISPVRIAQEGLLDTPNYTWTMYGEITRDGPLHRGTLQIPIPYSYPEISTALQVADLISQQETEVAAAQKAAGDAAASLNDALAALEAAQSALVSAQQVFDAADDALQSNLDAIDYWNSYDCGCGACALYDVICWSECGICEGSVFLTIQGLEKLTDGLRAAYDLARTGLLYAQGQVGSAQSTVFLAQSALTAANLSLQDSLDALSDLYQQRDSLPQEDGTFDATVELTLTDESLTGSVGGDFQGVPVGTGVVYFDDGPPRACFQPPVPDATEEFCTPL